MDTLPEEVITEILVRLKHSDVKCMRLINKKCYRASLAPVLIRREKFVYNGISHEDSLRTCTYNLFQRNRIFYHFSISFTTISNELELLVSQPNQCIQSIRFFKCQLDQRYLEICLKRCNSLKTLWLYKCNEYYQDGNKTRFQPAGCITTLCLPSVEDFHFTSRYLSDEAFNTYMDVVPNVKNVDLEDCNLSCHRVLFHRFYPRESDTIAGYNSSHILTFVNVLNFMTFKFDHLQAINLSYTTLVDECLMKIADIEFVNLKEICLNRCPEISDHGIVYFVQKQRKLEVVQLEYSMRMTNESLLEISRCLTASLQELKINLCSLITMNGLHRVIISTPIRRLYASVNRYLDESNVIPFSSVNYNLTELDLANRVLSSDNLASVLRCFPQLVNLNLSYCPIGVTDDVLQLICETMKKLKILNLSGCRHLSDNGFGKSDDKPRLSFGESFKNLEQLSLGRCYRLSDITIQRYLKLSSLRSLNLACCKQLTPDSFLMLGDNCPHLETLDLSSTLINDETLITMVSSMRRLRVLVLAGCSAITIDVLQPLARCSDYLTSIVLGYSAYHRLKRERRFVASRIQWNTLNTEELMSKLAEFYL